MVAVVMAVLAVASGGHDGGVDWGAEAFSVPAEVLRAAASREPASDGEAGTHWLYRSVHWSVDGEGRVTQVRRDIARLDGAEAVRDWSTMTLDYAPTHEAAPRVRAQVVAPDGRVFQLTPDMVHEESPRGEELVISDARSVSAALPGVRDGAIVELEVTWKTTRPMFGPAQASRFLVAGERPVGAVDVVLEHPRGVPLTVSFARLALARTDEDAGDVHRVRLHGERVTTTGARPGSVSWTTGASWQAVARGYRALVQPARAGHTTVDVGALVAGAKTRREKAQRLLEWLRAEVRYTGLEFGERSILPWAPAEVLKRGFGDCKDLALLLVELLGRAGVDARLALLDTEGTVDAASPSLAFFDHAIVYVPAARGEPATWVDATAANVPAGMLPHSYAGELALIVDDASTKLVPTWAPSSSDSARDVTLDVTLPDYGASRVRVTQRLTGLEAAWARDGIEHDGAKWMKEELEDLGDLVGVPALDPVLEPSGHPSEPAVYAGEAARVPMFYADWSDTTLELPERAAFDWLPRPLVSDEPMTLADGRLAFNVPYVATVTLRVHAPPGMVVTEHPQPAETRLGPAVLRSAFSTEKDGTVQLSVRLDTGKREYSQADVDAFRDAFAAWKKEPPLTLRLAFEASVLSKQGKVREMLDWYAQRHAASGQDVGLAARYAGDLLMLGLVDAAREQSRKLVMAHHDSALAWLVRGWVLSYDRFGNAFSAGFDRAGALSAMQHAHELEPGCTYCLEQAAWLEGYDDDGEWLSSRVDPKRVAAAYAAAWPKDHSSKRWVEVTLFAEDWAALRKALTEPSTPEQRAAILLADQMVDGADAAWKRWSARIEREKLSQAVDKAISTHLNRGRVDAALALAHAAGFEKEQPQLVRYIELMKKPPKLRPELETLRRLLEAALSPDEAERDRFVKSSMTSVPGGMDPASYLDVQRRGAKLGARLSEARGGVNPTPSLIAATLTLLEPKVDEVGTDRRVTVKLASTGGSLYLVRHDARWRVLAAATSRDLALWAQTLAAQRRAADARAWFAEARALWAKEPPGADTPEVKAVSTAWPTDDQLFVAALTPELEGSRKVLERALGTAPAKLRGSVLRLLLHGALRARSQAEASTWMAQLEAAEPNEPSTFLARTNERAMAGDFAGRTAADEAWLARFPGADGPQRDLAFVAAQQGELALATSRLRAMFQGGGARAEDYNNAAWFALFSEGATPDVVDWARRGGEQKGASWSSRHTLAVVLASDAKDIARTLEVFRGLATTTPEDSAWLVPARLAHSLGLRDEARALYRRLATPTKDPQSTAALAAKWLAELDAKAPARTK